MFKKLSKNKKKVRDKLKKLGYKPVKKITSLGTS